MKSKKILSALIAVIMILGIFPTFTFAASTITVTASNTGISQGTTTASITIKATNNPGIAVLGFKIGYDSEKMTLTSVTTGSDVFSSSDVTAGDISKKPYTYSAFTAEGNKNGNGLLLTLNFTVNANCPVGTYPITLSTSEAYTIDETPVDVNLVNGSIEVMKSYVVNGKTLPLPGYEIGKAWDNCWTFAKNVYEIIWDTDEEQDLLRKVTDDKDLEITATNTKKYIQAAALGSNIRLEDRKDINIHSLILVHKDSTGFVVYHGNFNGGIYFTEYTYESFAEDYKDYKYFEYITWPDAPAYEKTKQNITVSGITNKTYGDNSFKIAATPDVNSKLNNFTYESSNTNVAQIATDGTITIKAAGETNITVKEPGNEFYAPFTKTQKLTVNKAPITVKANDIQMVKGASIPALTYSITNGKLFGTDTLTGTLATNATGSKLGNFDITKGTLQATSNYNLTFVKGTLMVVDKTPQNITVSDITEKTYGDSSFVVAVTPDSTSQLTAFTFESSNTDVAEIAADGTVTIKAAGETDITVKQAGNATYAAFTKTQKLVVKKVAITINADAKMKKVGTSDPELTYQVIGELVNGDSITGSLSRKPSEEIGQYDILIGTLAINNNYDITYNKAIFEIVDKTPQNITVSDITEKIYGDSSFVITATPDTTSQLTEFTFESSNTDVAVISADGTVTIKAAGETDITVKQAGNDEYAAFEKAQKLIVNKKAITITSINADEKTSVFEGVLAEDTAVTLDYDKLNIEIVGAENDTTSNVIFTNFVLAGDKAENYLITTENFADIMSNTNIVTVTITADNGTVTGAGSYIKGSSVTATVTPNSGYNFSGWYVNDTSVSTETTYTFIADADTALVTKFARRSSGGGGGSTYYTVKFDTNDGTKVSDQRIKRNAVAKAPEAPTKDGFTFEGWYTDKELTKEYDFAAKVTKSITLYAKWTEIDKTKSQIILTIGNKVAKVFGEDRANDVAPKIVNDRTMLPARFVAESLGAKVEWDDTAPGIVTITKDDVKIVIYICEEYAVVNGEKVKLDSPAFIENDRTYTPIRFISEELGASVEWLPETQQVVISK